MLEKTSNGRNQRITAKLEVTHLGESQDIGGGAGLGGGRALLLDGRAVGHEGGPGEGHSPPSAVAPRGVKARRVHRPVQAAQIK